MKADIETMPVDAASARHPFSNLQWYLAHARSTVHFAKFTRSALSRDEVKLLITRALLRAPDLVRGESLNGDCHHPSAELLPDECLTFLQVPDLDFDFDQWLRDRQPALTDTGLPAFHAWYLASDNPDALGNCGVILFMTTHALAEGSDLGQILRSNDVRRPDMRAEARQPGFGGRLIMSVMAPLAALAHVLGAWFDKKKIDDFSHVSLVLDAAQVRQTAKSMGIKRKTLLFATVLHTTLPGIAAGKREMIAWSNLPKQRIAIEIDEYLKLQMQAQLVQGNSDFETFAYSLEASIDKQMASGVFTQHFYNAVLAFQRRFHRWFPVLYPSNFFGSANFGLVLSLLPPVRPGKDFPELASGPVFGGSRTNLVSNCIFVPGTDYLTMNFWVHKSRAERLPMLKQGLSELGIETLETR